MFTSSSNENYSSQTSLQSIKSSSTFTSSFTTTTKSNSQSFKSSPSLPIALQIVHDNEYITNQHEQNSTNEKILNHSLHHHNSLLVTSPLSIHHNNPLIEPSLRSRISPQRSR
ncbi:unnamed protein product [Schistosoma mattheei]|uniref:Uncharacterized protein n=1 Tax=Schistosoma mattheei TaxID=31246 RepID=A0A183PIZ9_9TREM|nr:unnamed protein product [Schistosoma mattheei]